ncbi:MAG: tripartite tricarboxylate transporter permease [Alphaproteobacteria bacterium]
MDLLSGLWIGLGVALQPINVGFCFVGALLGTLIGVLPGVGPVATIALLLPITFGLPATSAIIMLAGIFYGAQYGGSTTAILIKLPGETSSVVTVLDGYSMAQQGRAGAALATAALGSFFAGTVATVFVGAAGPLLTQVALSFSSAEYFSLMVLGLIASVVLAHGSVAKAIAMIFLGLGLGLVGTDVNSGELRFAFDIQELSDGIGFVPIVLGLFGVAEVIRNLEAPDWRTSRIAPVSRLWLTGAEFRQAAPAALRGTLLGSFLGVLPGGGASLAAFAAYGLEKKIARDPGRFGKGAIEGVAAPESANNAAAQTSFIPLLTLGLPTNAVMALMVGALIIQGIQPGPLMMERQPDLFWGLVASMWIGNAMLLVINLPLVGIWVRLLKVPYDLLYPAILVFSAIGVYSLNNNVFDVYVAAIFGLVGYIFVKLDCEPVPLILGFVLGPLMEEHLRRALLLSRGDPMVFVDRPISLGLIVVAALLLLAIVLPAFRKRREVMFQE